MTLHIINHSFCHHYDDVIMGEIASLITSLTIVYSTVYSDADQGKHQSSASLDFVWGIHRGLVNSPHKWPVTRKMLPFDDVIMLKWRFKHFLSTHFRNVSMIPIICTSNKQLLPMPDQNVVFDEGNFINTCFVMCGFHDTIPAVNIWMMEQFFRW